MANRKLIGNSIYSLLLQAASLLFSLLTSPYISEMLGAGSLGKVNFTTAIVGWFVIFSTFGTGVYGVVAIAKTRDDKQEMSKVFSELMVIKAISSFAAIVLYIIIGFSVPKFSVERNLYIVQGILILLNIFSVDWFFQGMENFKFLAIRSIAFKTLGVIMMFLFISSPKDYVVYALISVFSLACANLLNVGYVCKNIKISFRGLNVKRHLKPLGIFFVSALLINVYMMIDQTLLGFLKTDADVALFARARMFFNIGLVITGSINSAIAPILIVSYKNDKAEYGKLLRTTCNLMLFFALPTAAGLFVAAPQIMFLFGSTEFLDGVIALRILSLAIITVAVGSWNYTQRVVVSQKERYGMFVISFVAALSVLLNVLLIPSLGIAGSAISYLAVETIGNTIWYFLMNRVDKFRILRLETIKYFLGALVMAGGMYLLTLLLPDYTWLNLIAIAFLGCLLYLLFCIFSREHITKLVFKKLTTKKHD